MGRYRGYGSSNRRRGDRYVAPVVAEPSDPLRDAAIAASELRNQENYAIIADFGFSDKEPGDRERRKLAHFERLINLVGAADKAWRAVAERDGAPYTPCVDCGWLPRYQAAAESLRLQLRAIEAARSSGAFCALSDEVEQ